MRSVPMHSLIMQTRSTRFAGMASVAAAGALCLLAASLPSSPAAAQAVPASVKQVPMVVAQASPAPARTRSKDSSALGGLGGDSKEPIKIDADKLDVLDKENRAVFTGNVVAVQGETTVRCTMMTVFYEGRGGQQGGAASARAGAPAAAATPPATPAPTPAAAPATAPVAAPAAGNDSSIKRIECKGPVTVVSKTQAATSDNAVFDRANNQVIMTGNVALNDGPNITRGEKLVYNTVTGIANVQSPPGVRVQGFFVPNSAEAGKASPGAAGSTKPAKPGTPTN